MSSTDKIELKFFVQFMEFFILFLNKWCSPSVLNCSSNKRITAFFISQLKYFRFISTTCSNSQFLYIW